MRYGVVGGSGFIGSHIVDKLVEQGHEVTVFDIMRPPRDDVRHIHVDITDTAKTAVTLAGGYDAIYMVAAMADANDVFNNPTEATVVNIAGVANVLEAARRTGVARVILASTIWVYDLAEKDEVDEDTPLRVDMTRHVYTASKVAAEMLCHSYQNLYGLPFTILRYGIPYGPRAWGGVVGTFVSRASRGQPLTIQGDGSQYRRFVYVEDLAEGNVAALAQVAENQTYNLEGSQPVTTREVAETVAQLMGNVRIEYTQARAGDYRPKTISSLKAQRHLGWNPKTEFEEGVRRYIKWFQQLTR